MIPKKSQLPGQLPARQFQPPGQRPPLTSSGVQSKSAPVKPSVRPAATPPLLPAQSKNKVLQPKTVGNQQRSEQPRRAPIAPPVYRPQPTSKVAQPKVGASQRPQPAPPKSSPAAPPVYRPQSTPRVLQAKKNGANATGLRTPSAPGAPFSSGVIASRGGATVQRAARTRAQTLHELQVSSEIDERLILPEGEKRERKSPAVYGIGDGTSYGVGAHANYEGVSTTNVTRRFSAYEKEQVNALGNMYGCHWCGAKDSGWADGHFTPDHQPPLSTVKDLSKYKGKLYPHCKSCSSEQGGILSPCFLTTACVRSCNLPDDCEDLTVLRDFRDSYMNRTGEGRLLVEQYYEVAPVIVETIHRQRDAKEIYERLYEIISDCVSAIKDERFEAALQRYKQMVTELQASYL